MIGDGRGGKEEKRGTKLKSGCTTDLYHRINLYINTTVPPLLRSSEHLLFNSVMNYQSNSRGHIINDVVTAIVSAYCLYSGISSYHNLAIILL